MSLLRIRELTADDWPMVERIYREGIATGHATFESEPPSWHDFAASRLPDLRLVATDDAGQVLGWAAASATSARTAYRAPDAGGRDDGYGASSSVVSR